MDGVRPDAIQAARTPVMDRLVRDGAHTWQARTIMPSVTLPCHTSMLRGVEPARHGITTNIFTPLARPVPSLIDVAHDQGRYTGFFYNWEELRDLASPGKLHVSALTAPRPNWQESDRLVADQAVRMLEIYNLDLLFVYFGAPDEIGHRHDWMSHEYLDAIENSDACLGRVLDRIAELGRAEETTTLVLSDHGGHGRTHGTDCDEDMLIPWILHGPKVRPGHVIAGPVRIFDTCVTLAHIMGLTPSDAWEGRVITEALAE
jgi:predicted AlkP superfamily pyrophosphatase or phosphodiesterase